MLALCDEHFSWNVNGQDARIHDYLLSNGEKISLIAEEGEEESISYKSEIWKYWKISLPGIIIREDREGNPAAFALQNNQEAVIKHEKILEMVKRGLQDSDYLSGWPKMLSDTQKLDLNYTTECDTSYIPCFWPLRENKD